MIPTYKVEPDSDLTLFAISVFAWKPETREFDHRAFVAFDGTEDSAQKAGIKEARRLWPKGEGWRAHHVQVQPVEIQFRTVIQAVEAPEETKPDFVM